MIVAMPLPTFVLTMTPEAPEPHRHAGPFGRTAASVPPPGLLLARRRRQVRLKSLRVALAAKYTAPVVARLDARLESRGCALSTRSATR